MYARESKGDGAIGSKNRKLSYITGTPPILDMARAYGLRPRLWLLIIFNANIDFGFQGTEIHGALSVGHSRTSPVQSYKSTRTSIRQVAKMLAGKSNKRVLSVWTTLMQHIFS